jgi:hypothetical protein
VSPAWLEEGLASEVAVAASSPNALKFGYSWRDEVLKDDPNVRPQVSSLIEMPWSRFSVSNRSEIRQVAGIQAMAAVFIRYLDAKGKLSETYFAVRDSHFSPGISGFRSYREILESQLGMSIGEIDRDFERWFQQQHPPESALDRGSSPKTDAGGGSPADAAAPCRNWIPAYPAANAGPEQMNQPAPATAPCPSTVANPNSQTSGPKK